MNESCSVGGSLDKNYVAPKDWEVLTDSEKIERCRDVIKDCQSSISYLNNQVYKLRRQLVVHEHVDGKVIEKKQIQQYDDENTSSGLGCSSTLNKYF